MSRRFDSAVARLMAKIHRGALIGAIGVAIAGPLIYLQPESRIVTVAAAPYPWRSGALVHVRVINADAHRRVWVRAVDLSRSFVAGGRVFGASPSDVPDSLGDEVRFARDDELRAGAGLNLDVHVLWPAASAMRAGYLDVVFEDTSSVRVPLTLPTPATTIPAPAPGAAFVR